MHFTKIVGTQTPAAKAIVQETEDALTFSFLELSRGWMDVGRGSGIGGDPLQMQLVVPMPHYCDLTVFHFQPIKNAYRTEVVPALKTGIPIEDLDKSQKEIIQAFNAYKHTHTQMLVSAATNGNIFFWEPMFFLKKSLLGRRLLIGHESNHSILLHPSRCGHRIKNLWNIAIDFKTNYNLIKDLQARGFIYPANVFQRHLGNYATIEEYIAFLKDPYHPPPKLAGYGRIEGIKKMAKPGYALIDDDILSEELPPIYYADPNLPESLLQPEAIYDYLLKQVPVCPCCGRMGMYKKPNDFKALEKEIDIAEKAKQKTFQ